MGRACDTVFELHELRDAYPPSHRLYAFAGMALRLADEPDIDCIEPSVTSANGVELVQLVILVTHGSERLDHSLRAFGDAVARTTGLNFAGMLSPARYDRHHDGPVDYALLWTSAPS